MVKRWKEDQQKIKDLFVLVWSGYIVDVRKEKTKIFRHIVAMEIHWHLQGRFFLILLVEIVHLYTHIIRQY